MNKNNNKKINKKLDSKKLTKSDKINRQIQRGFDIATKWKNEYIARQK